MTDEITGLPLQFPVEAITDNSSDIRRFPNWQYYTTRALIVQSHDDRGVCALIVKGVTDTPVIEYITCKGCTFK